MNKQYAVLKDVTYYGGNCQHPSGWGLSVAAVNGDDCIGTLQDCKDWLDMLDDAPTYLDHGEAGKSYRIAEILDDDADYQSWVDAVDWSDCPGNDDDYDGNCAWAEQIAYDNNEQLVIAQSDCSRLMLIDLQPIL